MKKTAQAPSNIAFIKYWGVVDSDLRIPTNDSISMNLDALTTTTTVEFNKNFREDDILIDKKRDNKEIGRVKDHLERIRKLAGIKFYAKVVSENNFPSSSGLSSSASGFAALTLAATKSIGLNLPEKELSKLARLASGSACRSIPNGFVQWFAGDSHDTSYSKSIFSPDYFKIADIVLVVSDEKKQVPTTSALRLAQTSPFFNLRLEKIQDKIEEIIAAIKNNDFSRFGETIENEALELHAVIMTQKPSHIYWHPHTLSLLRLIRKLRKNGLEGYFTINTGHDVHFICRQEDVDRALKLFRSLKYLKEIIVSKPSLGTRIINKHLF